MELDEDRSVTEPGQIKQILSPDNKFIKLLGILDRPILSDGAMGTMLNASGISFDQCFDALNLSNPDLVAEIHQAYIGAGADVIQTNTFGANRYKLSEHDLGDRVVEINRAGVDIAQGAVDASKKDVLVAGDIGPLGVRLAPFGRVQVSDARQVFIEQIQALCAGGVDLLILETMTDLIEMQEAVKAARQVCDLPIVTSMTFTRDDRTLLGDSPAHVAQVLHQSGADVIGVNCSGGPVQILRIMHQMHRTLPEARLSAMPNAGWPERVGGRIMYPASPDYFGDFSKALRAAGACLIGGCCGTTPSHIAEMRTALNDPQNDDQVNGLGISFETSEITPLVDKEGSRLSQKLSAGEFIISVEMDPPRGLSTHKLLAGASLLAEGGADVINIADSPMARMRMSPWAVCSLIQREINVETVLHFPTRGRNLLRVQGDLLAAHALDIRNVFVVMGDPTAIGDFPDAMDDFDLVPSGLIRLIKCGFNLGKDHAGSEIGQPTSFFVGCALNLNPRSPEREISNLHRKIESGVDFILTQPIFQPELIESFLDHYNARYGPMEIPLIVGILPLFNLRHAAFLDNEVPGIDIPEEIQGRIDRAGERSAEEGVRIAVEMVEKMRSWVSGIYLMPAFNRYDLAVQILDQVK
ncbi:MAG: bifunctional homocysteine S-methyltransferase/methylenetetrahydrofolate reductase [Anaerolineales bacterium]